MQRRQFLINTVLTAGSVALLGHKSFASLLADPTYQFKPLPFIGGESETSVEGKCRLKLKSS